MNTRCVKYKGVYLDPNSKAFDLFKEGKTKELDAHLKKCLTEEKELCENDNS